MRRTLVPARLPALVPRLPALALGLPVLLLGVAACGADEPTRDESGAVTEEESVDAAEVRVGDCTEVVAEGEVQDITTIPCDQPHGSEAYFAFDLPDGDYPGTEGVSASADEGCLAEFEAFIGLPYEESVFLISSLGPTEEGWEAGDREVLCLVEEEGEENTGSARGAAR